MGTIVARNCGYDKLDRITKAGNERFAFDPAHNILSTRPPLPTGEGWGEGKTPASAATPLSDGLRAVTDNRIREYNGTSYYYDDFGNLIHRELPDGEVQNYFYDLHDQLVKVEIFKKDGSKETWHYVYDALGRRIAKYRELSDGLKADETGFVWDGSHLLQEVYGSGRYTYIYTDVDSYEPLAQIHNYTNEEFESKQETNYFHCDQIGIPREMTDREGKLLWFGDYYGWGKLKSETNITGAHQPFRLQNQYFDRETGLHYNFFRYYEPDTGRFVNQDPIKLSGGNNFYRFAPNTGSWIDIFGLWSFGDPLPQWLVDGAAGFGDTISFDITKKIREDFQIDGGVTESTGYAIGQVGGEIYSLAIPAKKVWTAYKGVEKAKKWKCEMKKLSKTAKKTRAKRVAKAKVNLKNVTRKELIKWAQDKINSNIFK